MLSREEKEACRAAYRSVPTVRMGKGRTYAAFEEGWRHHAAAVAGDENTQAKTVDDWMLVAAKERGAVANYTDKLLRAQAENTQLREALDLAFDAIRMYVAGIERHRHVRGDGTMSGYHASSSAGGRIALERISAALATSPVADDPKGAQ